VTTSGPATPFRSRPAGAGRARGGAGPAGRPGLRCQPGQRMGRRVPSSSALPGRRVLCPRGQAGLGYALPAALGVATADPGRRTVVLTGDGALGYAAGEPGHAGRARLPVTVVVLNTARSAGSAGTGGSPSAVAGRTKTSPTWPSPRWPAVRAARPARHRARAAGPALRGALTGRPAPHRRGDRGLADPDQGAPARRRAHRRRRDHRRIWRLTDAPSPRSPDRAPRAASRRPVAQRQRHRRCRDGQRRAAWRASAAGTGCLRGAVDRRAVADPARTPSWSRSARSVSRTTTCRGRGTLSLQPATLAAVLVDICAGLSGAGAQPHRGGELA